MTRWRSQTVYVPVYSHIYGGDRYRETPFNLTATLSVRNTDPEHPLTLIRVDYLDSEGKLLHHYLDRPRQLGPLVSTRFIVRESDLGGSGAKFILEWQSRYYVVEPIIEAVMIGTKMQQGISFISRCRVIRGDMKR